MTWLDEVNWNPEGLAPVIAQEAGTGKVLMLAWMNRESLQRTVSSGEAVYWSRSRNRLGTREKNLEISRESAIYGWIVTMTY